MVLTKGLKPLCCLSLLIGVLLFCACAPKPVTRQTALERLDQANYPDFTDHLNYHQLGAGIDMSLAYLRKLAPERPVQFGPDLYTVSHLITSLEAFAGIVKDKPAPEILRRKVSERFRVYRAAGHDASAAVLFTGYYEPCLSGRTSSSAEYSVPVHSRPADLVEIDLSLFADDLSGRRIVGRYADGIITPYPDRERIGRQTDFTRIAPPIAWLRDEIDLFNLMVQGSGKVILEDGRTLQLGFDSSNGRPYRSIGRKLIEQGAISAERMSMQAIREYLAANPRQAGAIMNYNPRYIFFRTLPKGPLGALGVPLTPRRSVAVDRALFPDAALAFISVSLPDVDEHGVIRRWAPYSGFALAQDTGSAISGPGRVDLFWGNGLTAEVAAGHLKHTGVLYFIVLDPRTANRR